MMNSLGLVLARSIGFFHWMFPDILMRNCLHGRLFSMYEIIFIEKRRKTN